MKIRIMAGAVALGLSLCVANGPASAQATAASQEELLFWDTIKGSSNPADFQEYLKQYPNGRFAGLARIRVRDAANTPRVPAAAAAVTADAAAMPVRPAAFPVPGESWKYRFLDRKYAPRHPQQYEVRVLKADRGTVTEALAPFGVPGRESTITISELGFLPRSLPGTKLAMEFSPYWIWRTDPMPSPTRIPANSGYPLDRNTAQWQVDVTSASAPAMVPAGTFGSAVKVVLKGSRQASFDMSRRNSEVARFEVAAWYAKEAGRVLKIEHRAWYGDSQPAADEVIDLLEHNVGGAAAAAEQRVAVAATAASPDLKIASGLAPVQGEIWGYRFTDKKYGNKVQPFTVRVDGVQGSLVHETIEPAGARRSQRSVDLDTLLFNPQPLPAEHVLVEFAPYFSQLEHAPVLPYKIRAGSGYPKSATSGDDWQVVLARLADAPVALGSGKVNAQRYQLKGMRRVPSGVARFEITTWYAPEAKRYIRLEHKLWNSNNSLATDDLVELQELPHR